MVSALLGSGADPSRKVAIYAHNTVWAKFLRVLLGARKNMGCPSPSQDGWIREQTYQIIDLLFGRGADPYVRLWYEEEKNGVKISAFQTRAPLAELLKELVTEDRRIELKSRYLQSSQSKIWEWLPSALTKINLLG